LGSFARRSGAKSISKTPSGLVLPSA
jgi:hypothetical protein